MDMRTPALLLMLTAVGANAQNTCGTAVPIGLGLHAAPQVTGTAPTQICAGPAAPGGAGLWYAFTPTTDMLVTVSSYVTGFPYVDTRARIHRRVRGIGVLRGRR